MWIFFCQKHIKLFSPVDASYWRWHCFNTQKQKPIHKMFIVPLQSRWWSRQAAAPYERSRKLHQTQRGLLASLGWPVAGEYKRHETTSQSAWFWTTNSFRLYQGNTMSYNKVHCLSGNTTVLGNMLMFNNRNSNNRGALLQVKLT